MRNQSTQFTIMHLLGMIFVVSACLAIGSAAFSPPLRGIPRAGGLTY